MTGASLGEALSAAIRHGSGAALQELEARNPDFDLMEALERIQELQQEFGKALCNLYTERGHIDAPPKIKSSNDGSADVFPRAS